MSFSKQELARLRERFLEQMAVDGNVTEVARRLGVNRNIAFGWPARPDCAPSAGRDRTRHGRSTNACARARCPAARPRGEWG